MTDRDNNVLRPDFGNAHPKRQRYSLLGRSATHIYARGSISPEQRDWDPAYVSQVILDNGDLVAGVSFEGLYRLYRNMAMNDKLLGRLRKLCDEEPRLMIHKKLCYPDQATVQVGVRPMDPHVEGFVATALREQHQIGWILEYLDLVTPADHRELLNLPDLLSIARMPQ